MPYTPGDPASPLQDGEVFKQMEKMSGEDGQDAVTKSFTVSLGGVKAIWQRIFNRNQGV